MPIYDLHDVLAFPPADHAADSGLLAVGGDLRPERLLLAYENGIFPWYNEDQPILWWSPAERMVLYPSEFKIKKSLRKALNDQVFELSIDESYNV